MKQNVMISATAFDLGETPIPYIVISLPLEAEHKTFQVTEIIKSRKPLEYKLTAFDLGVSHTPYIVISLPLEAEGKTFQVTEIMD